MCGKIADMARDNPKELTRDALSGGNPVSDHLHECPACESVLNRVHEVQARARELGLA